MVTAQQFKNMANALWGAYKSTQSIECIRRLVGIGYETLRRGDLFNQLRDLSTADKQKFQAALVLIKSMVQLLRDRL